MPNVIKFPRPKRGRSENADQDALYRKFNVPPPPKRPKRSARSWSGPSVKAAILTSVAAIVIGGGAGAWMALLEGRAQSAEPKSEATISTYFSICGRGWGENCVIDGDTFRYNGDKIRIVGIDTPETHPSKCPREEELGQRATVRLQELLNAGGFELKPLPDRDEDRYGRLLRYVVRNGSDVGDVLISEGLAHSYNGGAKVAWCP